MSSVRAPGKYFTLTLCFPVFDRFSSIPANIGAAAMRINLLGMDDRQNLFIICECNLFAVIFLANVS